MWDYIILFMCCIVDYLFVFVGAVFVALRSQEPARISLILNNRTESYFFKGVPEVLRVQLPRLLTVRQTN